MSEFVRFTKDGLRLLSWDSETRTYFDTPYTKGMVHLRSRCEIAEGVTLRDIMTAVDKDEELKTIIGPYSWCWHIDEFNAEVALPRVDKEDEDPLTQIEISRYGEILDGKLEISDHLGANSKSGTYYGISYTPLNQLADLPVVLITKVPFSVHFGRHSSCNDPFFKQFEKDSLIEPLFTVETHYSLLEVLDAIYWDISFAGGPEEKVEFMAMLNDRVDEINEHPEWLIPFDALKLGDEDDTDAC